MRRYVSLILSEEVVSDWRYALNMVAAIVGEQMAYHRLTEWPELVHSEEVDSYGSWRLVFVWSEEYV